MTRPDEFLALLALVLLLALFIRFTVFSGQQVRRMRWRTKLWLRRISFRLRMNPGAYMPLPQPVPLSEIMPGTQDEEAA